MRNTSSIPILVLFSFYLIILSSPISANEPVGLAAYTLEQAGLEWITHSTDHYRLHYLSGSTAEREIKSLAEKVEKILASHLALLGEKQYDKIIDIFYFNSRDQIKQIVSKPFRALADAESMTVLTIHNDDEIGRDAHEIMHVVSFDLWGRWADRSELAWLCEGLATYSDEPCNGYPMPVLGAYILQKTNEAVPLDSLATNFRTYPEMIGYPSMAGFVEFVLDKYGLDSFRQLWNEGLPGIERIFGRDIAELEREWHQYVFDHYPNPEIPDWPDLKEHGCK